jgi:hypothetical protein
MNKQSFKVGMNEEVNKEEGLKVLKGGQSEYRKF